MTAARVLHAATVADVRRLAAYLALFVRKGDIIALNGDLGAGKTTLARALIESVTAGREQEIPSPTFSLVQVYDAGRLAVAHFDFYRLLEAGEADEAGLDDALERGLTIIEWPERVPSIAALDRLVIRFEETASPDKRRVSLVPTEGWQARTRRLVEMMAFCEDAGWGAAEPHFLQGDASPRGYARLIDGEQSAILMDAPAMPDGPPIRDGRSYSALAHLAEDVRAFVAVAGALREIGLSAPAILAADLEFGLVLMEDFGDTGFAEQMTAGTPLQTLYGQAVDVLVKLTATPPPRSLALPDGSAYTLALYDVDALLIEVELLVDWYLPAVIGRPAKDQERRTFRELWRCALEPVCGDDGWVLRDYHSPNLMWLEEREGVASVGLLDFQDAVRGHAAYDLVSLLQDARLDVPADDEAELFARYCEGRRATDAGIDDKAFAHAYALLGAQRNTKILGIFARLAVRDGKSGYLRHLPRIWQYLERDLAHPGLDALREWFARHLPAEQRDASVLVKEPR